MKKKQKQENKVEELKPEVDKSEVSEASKDEAVEDKKGEGHQDSKDAEDGSAAAKTEKKSRKKWLIFLAAAFGAAVLLIGAYVGIGVYYQTRFLPNTEINGIDCSGLTAAEATALLDEAIEEYSLEVIGRDYATGEPGVLIGEIKPQDIQLAFADTMGAVEELLAWQEWTKWIEVFADTHYSHSLIQGVVYDDAMLESTVKSWNALQKNNMIKARDAYIGGYSEELQAYEIVPETFGTELDVKQVVELVGNAVTMHETMLDLNEFDLYNEAKILRDDNSLTAPVETANRWLGTNITYDWNGNEVVVDANTIRDWVTIENGKAVLDEDGVKSFVKKQSQEYDTYGKKKNFVTTLGVEMTLNSPSFGWRTDTEAEAEELVLLIQEGSTSAREPVYTHQGMEKGENDIGNSYVEADLTNQHLYLYEDGEVTLETDFVSGRISNGNGTPAGIFGITYKARNAVLRGENYATPVSYWMPFYGNYGMHDASWRGSFGGAIYLTNGSHGCINLPPSMAAKIYEYVSTGFPVICYYYSQPVAPQPSPEPETAVTDPADPETADPEAAAPESAVPETAAPEAAVPETTIPEAAAPEAPAAAPEIPAEQPAGE